MSIETTVGFTGHRPDRLGGYDSQNDTIEAVRVWTTKAIWAAYQRGYRTYISGMALGFDQEAAKLVIRLRNKYPNDVRLIGAIPFKGQQRTWPLRAQQEYKALLEQCDELVLVCDGEYADWKMRKRNQWIVDNAGLIIACWDGARDSGTFNCLQSARQQHRTIWNIWERL